MPSNTRAGLITTAAAASGRDGVCACSTKGTISPARQIEKRLMVTDLGIRRV
jgi:hypothetical protein